ncbi:mycofactocin-coupled SDR family oxidoreductase [Actinomadura sp. LD22]|uniref:Mycofactocin-coupled SDR family oxidoreductase n=1 Tax=Actinomadura physcomitrii TaxID=2650748 RepID=A0A6I4MAG5_9ACTN|nr:mycofactocin-coupled SDR family oxidoreductase [Actinomadura physcomitrii]MWA03238.1 mycofactocin-coupled SDR family oxidoreductase [Actinomadura physcomitrii]
MSGLLEGKVAFISGIARGQGRAHALRLAREGARIIGFDICAHIDTVPFSMGTAEDLAETERLVRGAGGEIVASKADARDQDEIVAALNAGLDAFGRVDFVVANAGIGQPFVPAWEMEDEAFLNVVNVNLVGAWRTAKAAVPRMIDQGDGGAIVVTGSGASLKGLPNLAGYVASKHGLIGLTRTLARELGPHRIRANAVLPGNTNTPMFNNAAMRSLFVPDGEGDPPQERFLARAKAGSPFGLPYVEPEDIAEAVLWLLQPASRYVTGMWIPVDGGTGIP